MFAPGKSGVYYMVRRTVHAALPIRDHKKTPWLAQDTILQSSKGACFFSGRNSTGARGLRVRHIRPTRQHSKSGDSVIFAPSHRASTSVSASYEESDAAAKIGTGQSSWTSKDVTGQDYLKALGGEGNSNMNIDMGAREGVIDHKFVGNFLGVKADFASVKYRTKVTRDFGNLKGDYYICPEFEDRVALHITKNFLADQISGRVPLILGIWGGKGQGKSFQTELVFRKMGVEPVILSAGEMESEWAGEPGRLIRDRYLAASDVIKTKGKLSCLMINDLDAGVGRMKNSQMTVNNQIVVGTLMALCDCPRVPSMGQAWREGNECERVPIIITGNDLSKLYAPLTRDGRMDKYYWRPTREDTVSIVHQMFMDDSFSREEIGEFVDHFQGQSLDFFGAVRARMYDHSIREWAVEQGTLKDVSKRLVRARKEPLPPFKNPEWTLANLLAEGEELVRQQKFVMESRLSEEYMRQQTGEGSLIGLMGSE
eukprot:jgi/Mesvir1/6796/Mv08997-RA.1